MLRNVTLISALHDLTVVLMCEQLPRERIPFPRDFVPRISQCVVLVLEPYRDFISSLPEDALSPDEMEVRNGLAHHSTHFSLLFLFSSFFALTIS